MIKKVKRILKYFNKPQNAAYIFILPAILILLIFSVVPLLMSVIMSFLKINIFLNGISFDGIKNFEKILVDERFWNSFKNTVYFVILEVPFQIILALLVGVYVCKNTKFRKFLRSTFFLPAVCSMTAIGIVWSFLLDPQIGMYPHFLTLLGAPALQFLRDPVLAMPLIIFITVWKNFGFSMVILVAGIQSIPNNYYEAAEIDGATKIEQFFKVTIPLLIPSLTFCIITNTIGSLQVFDQIFVITQGGPLFKTETIVAYIYNVGFNNSPYDLGYASSIAVVLFSLIVLLTLIMNNYLTQKEIGEM